MRAGVEVLATLDGEPVLLREGRFLVGSFHPELTDDLRVHQLFLDLVEEEEAAGGRSSSGRRSSGRRARRTPSGAALLQAGAGDHRGAREEGQIPPGTALQNAIEKAKEASMPKDNIERAIARGAGPSADGAVRDRDVRGVRTVRDRRLRRGSNRQSEPDRCRGTAHLLQGDGSLGESGSVAWLFERRAVVLVDGSADEDELTLAAAEGGADDVEREGDSWRVAPPGGARKRS